MMGMSDYEKRRLENMQRNHAIMVELGLEKKKKKRDEDKVSKKRKKRKKTTKNVAAARSKRTLRSRTTGSKGTNVLQMLVDTSSPKTKKKKKIVKRNPPISLAPPVGPLKTLKLEAPRATWRKGTSTKGWTLLDGVDPDECQMYLAGINANGDGWSGVKPQRDSRGVLFFSDHPDFRPNLSPKEVLHAGSFGGGYFRSIKSKVTNVTYENVHEELPENWVRGLDLNKMVCSDTYQINVNTYKADCGAKMQPKKDDPFGLNYWEMKHWINEQDPYGWFHWYCRFFQGRRSEDDARQISRWCKCTGPRGRWKRNLIAKVLKKGTTFDDFSVSPVVRQTLQHWAYRLSKHDFDQDVPIVRERGASYFPKSQLGLLKKK